jgi:hypothetical protein
MASIDDIISSAKLPEKTIELCLRGDLQAQWEDLERQFQAVQEQDGDTLGGGAHARDLADRMAGVAEEMRSHQVTFLFRGLSHRAYSDLLKAHKAPEEKRDEAVDGLDWGTYPTALIAACAVDPAMSYEQAHLPIPFPRARASPGNHLPLRRRPAHPFGDRVRAGVDGRGPGVGSRTDGGARRHVRRLQPVPV